MLQSIEEYCFRRIGESANANTSVTMYSVSHASVDFHFSCSKLRRKTQHRLILKTQHRFPPCSSIKRNEKKSRHINRIVIIRTTSILTEIFVFSLQNSIESIFKFHFEKKVVVHIWNSFYLSETRVYSVYK